MCWCLELCVVDVQAYRTSFISMLCKFLVFDLRPSIPSKFFGFCAPRASFLF
ncbi:hypothetical protein SLEP1_g58166 [Rubroshorea leprosula]|uniref:Uncharacterized protein n=1 Tax=Rubroshorea leprosula TaxID=152421 RepID=A0AAV5MS22_9ROSI|nr:hypothetical protein SLEP1_g58166 [Rubroshorea leprosula]